MLWIQVVATRALVSLLEHLSTHLIEHGDELGPIIPRFRHVYWWIPSDVSIVQCNDWMRQLQAEEISLVEWRSGPSSGKIPAAELGLRVGKNPISGIRFTFTSE